MEEIVISLVTIHCLFSSIKQLVDYYQSSLSVFDISQRCFSLSIFLFDYDQSQLADFRSYEGQDMYAGEKIVTIKVRCFS